MIRVVITGSECTGKTTLCNALAAHYEAPTVDEYVRHFVAHKGSPPTHDDVEAIARGQLAIERDATSATSRLLIQDTDLLSTVIYSHHYFGGCPQWIDEALMERPGNLYLLAGIDVPWVADGTQRDRGDRRDEMQTLFRNALEDRNLPYEEVGGAIEARRARATEIIDTLV